MNATERLLHDMAAEITEAMTAGMTYDDRPELDANAARRLLRRYEKWAAGVRSRNAETVAAQRKTTIPTKDEPKCGAIAPGSPAGSDEALRRGETKL